MLPKNKSAPSSWKNPEQLFHQALQSPWYQLIFQLMTSFTNASHTFYTKNGLAPALMPITCTSVSSPMGLGSDSIPVAIDLFGRKTYLADSMQFQLEYLMRQHNAGTWYIMPTFRGEEHDSRHLNQFFHSEAEIPGTLDNVMDFVGRYIHEVTQTIWMHHQQALEAMVGDTKHITDLLSFNGMYPQISHREACEMLGEHPDFYEEVVPNVKVITSRGEQALMDYFNGLVWLTHLPAKAVPFYQAALPSGEALCADLLFGIGETVGCGQRHADAEQTLAALKTHQVNPDNYAWYLHMKKEFPMQTSGFGLGLERYLLWLLKHDDIRDIPLMTRLKGQNAAP